MPDPLSFEVTAPDGRKFRMTGDHVPSEAELKDIWAKLPAQGLTLGPPGTPATPPQSRTGRFFSEAYESALGEPAAGVVGLAETALDQGPVAAAKQAGAGIFGPVIEHLKGATAARRAGRYTEWLAELAKAIPVLGPVGEQIYRQAARGDSAGALGRASGIAATFAVPKAMKALKPGGVVGAGGTRLPMTVAERTGIKSIGFTEALTERTISGAGVFARFRARQQGALQQMADEAAARIGSVTSQGQPVQGAETVGQAVQTALTRGKEAAKAQGNLLYNVIKRDARAVDLQASTLPLKAAAQPLLRELVAEERVITPSLLKRSRQTLMRVMRSPDTVPFTTMMNVRSSLLAMSRSLDEPIRGKMGGLAVKLAGAADEALLDAATRSGIPDFAERVREANQFWRDAKTLYNDRFIKKLLDQSPEKIPEAVRGATMDQLRDLRHGTSPAVWKDLRARVMRDVVDRATKRQPAPGPAQPYVHPLQSTGLTPGGVPPPVTDVLSGEVLRNELQKLGSEKASLLFGQGALTDLDRIADLAERVGSKANKMIPGLLAGGLNAAVLSPILRPWGIEMVTIPTAIGTATGFNVLARVLTAQWGIRTIRSFLSAIGEGNRPLAMALGLRLSAMATQEDPATAAPSTATPPTPGGGDLSRAPSRPQ